MKSSPALLLALCFIGMLSCNKGHDDERTVAVSALTFGKVEYSNESAVKYYKLTSQEIYKDSITTVTGQILLSALPLSQQKQSIARHLLDRLPKYLIDHPNQTFGCPSCTDQGLVYIETTIQGVSMKWYIDPTNFPSDIKFFVADLNTTMEAL
jgi:hypothetical protein